MENKKKGIRDRVLSRLDSQDIPEVKPGTREGKASKSHNGEAQEHIGEWEHRDGVVRRGNDVGDYDQLTSLGDYVVYDLGDPLSDFRYDIHFGSSP